MAQRGVFKEAKASLIVCKAASHELSVRGTPTAVREAAGSTHSELVSELVLAAKLCTATLKLLEYGGVDAKPSQAGFEKQHECV